jgi:cyclophilin family peptidyl-prolyl cis-trans isomerase
MKIPSSTIPALCIIIGPCFVGPSAAFIVTSTRSLDNDIGQQHQAEPGVGPLFRSQQRHRHRDGQQELVPESESLLLSTAATAAPTSRRNTLISAAWILSTLPYIALAADAAVVHSASTTTTTTAASATTAAAIVTDRIFVDIVSPTSAPATAATNATPNRIVIGLFGKAAPASVAQLRQLVSVTGLAAPCRPRAQRSFQKDQLEANKVYNSCMDGEREGVSLRYSTVWRIRKDEGIDVGAVTGKYVAREYPTYTEEEEYFVPLSHDTAGLVSVRRGNESGFGFTISPRANPDMDADYIVVGRVLDGMEVVEQLNEIPVVNSAPVVNYMALTGGPTTQNAPDRSCRYGGPMYCNENKPLVKLKISDCGVLKIK